MATTALPPVGPTKGGKGGGERNIRPNPMMPLPSRLLEPCFRAKPVLVLRPVCLCRTVVNLD